MNWDQRKIITFSIFNRSEQASGFSLIIDRRCDHGWDGVRNVFRRIISLFPARVREIYLLHNSGGDRVSQLIDELLLDFDVYYLEDPVELPHYIDTKYVPTELGGQARSTVESWLLLQEHVEAFRYLLATPWYISLLNKLIKFNVDFNTLKFLISVSMHAESLDALLNL